MKTHTEASLRKALVEAGNAGDIDRIDAITDELAERGLCRPRHDISMLGALKEQCKRNAGEYEFGGAR